MDVTSLYPWVNTTQEYPIGHAIIITNPENQDIHAYFGEAKVDVIPPYHLLHPVLPFRQRGKLSLPLCRTCMEEMTKGLLEKLHLCPHSLEERLLRGKWCTPELVKAVEVGYHIIHIHEVWHFPEEQCQKGLFADYVNTVKNETGISRVSWMSVD